MSKYLVFSDCIFPDRDLLLAALARLGFDRATVELGEHLPLYGYRGDRRPETAEIVVRRQHLISGSNDLGFARTPQGYVPIISAFDRQYLRRGRFLQDLRVAYGEAVAERLAQRLRGALQRQVDPTGVVRLTIRY